MSTTLTLDPMGGLFVPAALLERAHLLQGQTVAVEVEHDRLVVKPAMASEAEGGNADTPANLVKKGLIQVFTGFERPFDAVAAVEQARADREEQLLAHRNGG